MVWYRHPRMRHRSAPTRSTSTDREAQQQTLLSSRPRYPHPRCWRSAQVRAGAKPGASSSDACALGTRGESRERRMRRAQGRSLRDRLLSGRSGDERGRAAHNARAGAGAETTSPARAASWLLLSPSIEVWASAKRFCRPNSPGSSPLCCDASHSLCCHGPAHDSAASHTWSRPLWPRADRGGEP